MWDALVQLIHLVVAVSLSLIGVELREERPRTESVASLMSPIKDHYNLVETPELSVRAASLRSENGCANASRSAVFVTPVARTAPEAPFSVVAPARPSEVSS